MLRPMLSVPFLRWLLVAVLLHSGLAVLPAKQAAAQQVDLELLLAVDASSSVNPVEFDLQMSGIAAAFRHPAVLGALRSAGDRGIAGALMQWSDSNNTILSIDWMLVTDEASAMEFAGFAPRVIEGSVDNIKITQREDLRLAALYIHNQEDEG